MALVPEGSPFGLLRHMASNPLHFIIMGGVMIAVMVAVMMMLR